MYGTPRTAKFIVIETSVFMFSNHVLKVFYPLNIHVYPQSL